MLFLIDIKYYFTFAEPDVNQGLQETGTSYQKKFAPKDKRGQN